MGRMRGREEGAPPQVTGSGGVLAPSQSVHAWACAAPQAAPLGPPYKRLRHAVNPLRGYRSLRSLDSAAQRL